MEFESSLLRDIVVAAKGKYRVVAGILALIGVGMFGVLPIMGGGLLAGAAACVYKGGEKEEKILGSLERDMGKLVGDFSAAYPRADWVKGKGPQSESAVDFD